MVGPVLLTVLPDGGSVLPGGSLAMALTIRSTSSAADRYRVAVTGIPMDWCSLDRSDLSLAPGDVATVNLTIAPPTGSAAGAYDVVVVVNAEDDPSFASSLPMHVAVGGGTLGMDLSPVAVEGNEGTYYVTFLNKGAAEAAVTLDARDDEDGLTIVTSPAGEVSIPPGGEQQVRVAVRPKVRETIGEPHLYDIDFIGRHAGSSSLDADPLLSRRGSFTYQPRFTALAMPIWMRRLPLWLLIVFPLLLLALVFLAGNRVADAVATKPATATPAPAITPSATPVPTVDTSTSTPLPGANALPKVTAFTVQAGKNNTVIIHWSVNAATTVTLDGNPVPNSGANVISATAGRTVVLSASNASGTVTQLLHLTPPPIKPVHVSVQRTLAPPAIEQFTVVPGADGRLHLQWRVIGADTVLVDGKAVAASASTPLGASGSPTHELRATNVAGTVVADLALPPPQPPKISTVVISLPTIVTFTVSHPAAGQPYALVWKTSGAATVTLNGRAVALSGSQPLPQPIQPATYTLVARNANGQTQAQTQVTVQ